MTAVAKKPSDATIVAIVDSIEIGGNLVYQNRLIKVDL